MGLGLNVIYNFIVQKLHGEIVCSSINREGTMFTIILPEDIVISTVNPV